MKLWLYWLTFFLLPINLIGCANEKNDPTRNLPDNGIPLCQGNLNLQFTDAGMWECVLRPPPAPVLDVGTPEFDSETPSPCAELEETLDQSAWVCTGQGQDNRFHFDAHLTRNGVCIPKFDPPHPTENDNSYYFVTGSGPGFGEIGLVVELANGTAFICCPETQTHCPPASADPRDASVPAP